MTEKTLGPDAALNFYDDIDIGFCIVEMSVDAAQGRPDYRFLEVNEAFERHSGLQNATGQWMRSLAPAHEQFWFNRYAEIARSGRPYRFEYLAKALGNRHFEVFAYRVGDPEQQRVAILFSDISTRKFEEARRAALAELSGCLMQEGKDTRTITDVACRLLGKTLGVQLVGYGSVDPMAETIKIERDWTTDETRSIAGTLKFRDFGTYIDDLKRGERVVVNDARTDPRTQATAQSLESISVRALVNTPVFEQGVFVALQFVCSSSPREWTKDELQFIQEVALRTRAAIARVDAENALRTSEEQHRRSLQQMPSFVAIVYEPNQVFQYVNDAFITLFGHRQYIGCAAEKVLPELVGQDFFEPLSEAFGSGEPYSVKAMPLKLGTADDAHRFIDLVYQPLKDVEDEVTGIFISGYDVTDRVRAQTGLIELNATLESRVEGRTLDLMRTEEALRQSQKMEAVGQLTGGLAHDFNNLLSGISGALELTQVRLQQERFKEIERYTTLAQGAVKRAAALTHRLLAFSRRQKLDPKTTNVISLIHGMLELIQRTVGPSVQIQVDGDADLWPALVDPSQLENALLNLCINARDAMPDGGSIMIETFNVSFDEAIAREYSIPAGDYLSLCVADTGSGMPPDVVARVFEPFFTTKPLGEGTGLGLSMIYGFAQQSGGRVRIDSRVGQGTRVFIYLPRHQGESLSEALPTKPTLLPAKQGATVLVVDDEPTVRILLTDILEDLGCTPIEASDSSAGLTILESNARIDLLVTDVGLPGGMNGRQMADAARISRPKLKVLFITGYAESAVFSNGLSTSGMSVITKPFSIESMAERIRSLVEEECVPKT